MKDVFEGIWYLLAIVFMFGGIAVGLYTGIWWGIVGGAVQIIEQIGNDPVVAMEVFKGIVRIFFAGPIGFIVGIVPFGIGAAMTKY